MTGASLVTRRPLPATRYPPLHACRSTPGILAALAGFLLKVQALNTASLPLVSRPICGAGLGLGLDAGGTQTRWAVADASGAVQRQGQVAGISALQLQDDGGRASVAAALAEIAAAAGPVQAVVAGLTGFDAAQQPALHERLAIAFGVQACAVQAMSDIELLCHAAFAPGDGYVVYAGTGSIAAFIDAQGVLQRAGGRGAVIDDAGGGHWIAREALRHIWRAEDSAPGAWRQSPLARRVFERLGGSDWAQTRQWVYCASASRGEMGTLAVAVAAVADEDPAALAILQAAGTELARLAAALVQRFGARPVVLSGRVFELHPIIQLRLEQALPAGMSIHRLMQAAHVEGARMAAGTAARTAARTDARTAARTAVSTAAKTPTAPAARTTTRGKAP